MPANVGSGRTVKFSGGVDGVTTLIEDAFTDADLTALTAHTIAPTNVPAVSWVQHAGTTNIVTNVANTVVAAVRAGCHVDVADADVTVQAGYNGITYLGTNGGIGVRLTDASNMWWIRFTSNTAFEIHEVNAGTATQRATIAFTPTDNVTYLIKCICAGNVLTATIDGANEISYASASFQNTATKHGLAGPNATVRTWNDFKVTSE